MVREGVHYSKSEGADLSLSVSVSGTDNSYQWYKNTMSINGAGSDTYTIMGIQQSDAGLYHCEVTNSTVPGLTLRSLADMLAVYSLESDSLALVALYDNTDGANWTNNTNWKTGLVNTWAGITVTNDRVSGLILRGNQLSGSIPTELKKLTNLTLLNLTGNQLSGSIPTELKNLTNLTLLNLTGNQLSGSIPAELGNLTNLTLLNLSDNQLTGSIPTELGNLTNLIFLDLSRNQLSGSIPVELGNLTSLTRLYLWSNQLTESIPTELGNLTNLIFLDLSRNQLSGGIPTALGSLTSLEALDLQDNQLNTLPDLSSLAQLIICRVQNNRLDFADITPNLSWLGSTPSSGDFQYSPQVVREGVHYSKSEGTDLSLSVSVSGTGNSYQWYKDAMSISGAGSDTYTIMGIQQSDTGLYHCEVTRASTVPGVTLRSLPDTLAIVEILASDSLALVALYDNTDGANWTNKTNWKTGFVSTWYGITATNDRVSGLNLSGNGLSGDIPTALGNLTGLTSLNLSNNRLTSFPDLATLTQLTEFSVENNRLSFEDITPHLSWLGTTPTGGTHTYSPQVVREGVKYMKRIDTSLSLSVNVPGTGNVYQWYKDSVSISGEAVDALTIATIQPSDDGLYHCEVTNPSISGLTLYSLADTLVVDSRPIGIVSGSMEELLIYPNPSTGYFVLEYDKPAINVQLLDFTGKIVPVDTYITGKTDRGMVFDLFSLSRGTYILKVASRQGKLLLK